jgi:hypothetical protein
MGVHPTDLLDRRAQSPLEGGETFGPEFLVVGVRRGQPNPLVALSVRSHR